MSAKQEAIRDIREDLKENSKAFIVFRKELNPIMDSLVRNYKYKPSKRQLVAVCFYSNGKVKYNNYLNYYGK